MRLAARAVRCWWPALLLAGAAAQAGTTALRVEPARAGTHCVADPDYMRLHHMDLLRHQRDLTVHQGPRGRYSLEACVDCHAGATTHSVAQAPTDFCVACHRYAAVRIDCFECHASRPASVSAKEPS
ncbi:MAG: hypothetical protein KGL18_13050 [Burkholderiales bacterium]|nr:hypothetical protein [Burkholderiales bacterium]MDE1926840.1 hypothetical protein [Burkholderiales bacterium]MDE2503886.1 hypothetical protein [Burkholderiales bacterium]